MKELALFLIFLFSVSSAQQLESLKFFKKKHDSISRNLKEELNKDIQGKSIEEQNKIYANYNSKILKNSIETNNNYKLAVREFLEKQNLKSDNVISANTNETKSPPDINTAVQEIETAASYSLGFPELYKEVHNFIKNNVTPLSHLDYSSSSKIHFVVKEDSSLFIEKVEGTNPDFNDISLLAFLMTNGKWIPAKQKEKLVKCKFILPIKFIIEE